MEHEPTIQIDGAKVRRLREQQKLTQLYMATVVEVTTDTISRWENKRYPSIKRENALKLAEALGVSFEELLEKEEEIPEVCDDKALSLPHKSFTGKIFLNRHRIILCVSFVFVLGLAFWLLLPGNETQKLQAVRYLPAHVLPGQPFPVLVKVNAHVNFSSSFLLRESLPVQCSIRKTIPSFLTQDETMHHIKWISTMERERQRTFSYLIDLKKDVAMKTKLRFSGTIVMGRRGSNEPKVLGVQVTEVTSFHWADENLDSRIDDYELLSVYELFPNHRELGIDVRQIEAIWASPGYRWNSEQGSIDLLSKKDSLLNEETPISKRK